MATSRFCNSRWSYFTKRRTWQSSAMLKTKLPSPDWVETAKKAGFTKRRGPKQFQKLKNKLLAVGGWAVCIRTEGDLEKLLTRGVFFPGRSISMKGEPCQCHMNSACCWEANKEISRIGTGYALSRDGMWRQHSWVVTHSGAVIETTEKRIQYYGFVMTAEECEDFFFWNT